MATLHHKPINPNSLKTKFTYKFLQALKKLNEKRSSALPVHRIKVAADASLVSAVGSSRSWSRAVLWRIQNRSRLRRALTKRISIKSTSHSSLLRRKRRRRGGNPKKEVGLSQEDVLRKLVPGGEAMNICTLLDETAHYIKCLTTQVQVMGNLVNLYTCTWGFTYSTFIVTYMVCIYIHMCVRACKCFWEKERGDICGGRIVRHCSIY